MVDEQEGARDPNSLKSFPSLSEKLREAGFPKIAHLGDALATLPLISARPVWYGDSPQTSREPQMRNATVTLLELDGLFLAVTCEHVISSFEGFRDANPAAVFGVHRTQIDVDSCIRARSRSLDLVTLDVTPYVQAGLLEDSSFHRPPVWPPSPVSEKDVIAVAGFPGIWRKHKDIGHFQFFTFSSGAGEVTSVREDYLYTRFRLDDCIIAARDGLVASDLGGLSGGPVWAWRPLHLELVGFVKEYQPDYDLLYVRRALVVSRDGTLN